MSGERLTPAHPAANQAYDEMGRLVQFHHSEAELRLECLKIARDALGRDCSSASHLVAWSGALAEFVLGTASAVTNQPEPVDLKAEAPQLQPLPNIHNLSARVAILETRVDGIAGQLKVGHTYPGPAFAQRVAAAAGNSLYKALGAKAPERPAMDPEVEAAIQGWSRVGFASLQRALNGRNLTVDMTTAADGSWVADIGGPVCHGFRKTTIIGRHAWDQVTTVLAALADRWPAFTLPEPPTP